MRMYHNSSQIESRRLALTAFTLLELLVVIGIIGILAVSSVPAIRSLSQSNTLAAGHRQILDDLSLARHHAITGRRTVYMVFVPPTVRHHFAKVMAASGLSVQEKRYVTNGLNSLIPRQYSGYALYTAKAVGSQPGRFTPKYLTPWKELPDGMFLSTNKFVDLGEAAWRQAAKTMVDTNRPLPYAMFPFPTAESPEMRLPFIAFNAKGQLSYDLMGGMVDLPGEAVALSRGSILYPKDKSGTYLPNGVPDVVETPRGNFINVRVNWLTGRAKVELPELK